MAAWVDNTQTGLLGHIKLLLVCFAKVLAIYGMYVHNKLEECLRRKKIFMYAFKFQVRIIKHFTF